MTVTEPGEQRRFPQPWSIEDSGACIVVKNGAVQKAGLRLLRRGARPAIDREVTHPRRGAAYRGQRGETAGAVEKAIIRSVELIVQPEANDLSGKVRIDHHGLSKRGRIAERDVNGLVAEIYVEIFSLDAPLRGEHPVDAATRRPTGVSSRTAAGA